MNKIHPARWRPIWLFCICLAAVTLVPTMRAFSAEEAAAEVVEEKSSKQPETVREPLSELETDETPDERQTREPEEQLPEKKVTETPDVFNPSEEISEDFAVAFPVDI
ncbi:MAG: hypothetical protein O7E57_05655 [Gammaproteobacteria bacterium]|nr:hypothetical protein [Gammaproteobacteria bacterium]